MIAAVAGTSESCNVMEGGVRLGNNRTDEMKGNQKGRRRITVSNIMDCKASRWVEDRV